MANQSASLIVNYLPHTMTDGELYNMFITIGPVESCRIMKDFKTGFSYGFGFVNYISQEHAEKAIKQLNGLEIFNKRIKVSYARPSGDDIKDTNLYVTNLPKLYTETDLERLFEPYGNIVHKNLLLDKFTGMPRGNAFVRFNRREEAQSAINNLNGQILDGAQDKLSVRVAEEHGKQKAAFYAGLQAGLMHNQGSAFDNRRGGRGFYPRVPPVCLPRPIPPLQRPVTPLPRPMAPLQRPMAPLQRPMAPLPRVVAERGGGIRGNFTSNNSFTNPIQTVPFSYSVRPNNFGALKQDKMPQRYNPISFKYLNNNSWHSPLRK